MKDEIKVLCDQLDVVRKRMQELQLERVNLDKQSYDLDSKLQTLLHANIDPLLKGSWSVRLTIYKESK